MIMAVNNKSQKEGWTTNKKTRMQIAAVNILVKTYYLAILIV